MMHAGTTGLGGSVFLAEVTGVSDPENLGRLLVTYPLNAAEDDVKTEVMAMVATPFAGASYGAFMMPGVGDVVVLAFLSGDVRTPVILGSVWAMGNAPIETPGEQMDKWVMQGRGGTRVSMNEAESPVLEIATPGGNTITLADNGSKITISAAGGASKIEMDAEGVKITAPKVTINASAGVDVTSGKVEMQTAMCNVSGVVKGNVGQLTTVVSGTYTPGAGNML